MLEKQFLFELEVPSDNFYIEPSFDGRSVLYGYNSDGQTIQRALRFEGIVAVRMRTPRAVTAWHVEDAYYKLVIVKNSDWLTEIMRDTADRQTRFDEVWALNHYLIYLEDLGSIEWLASGWRLE